MMASHGIYAPAVGSVARDGHLRRFLLPTVVHIAC